MASVARCTHCGGPIGVSLDDSTLAVIPVCLHCGREPGAAAPTVGAVRPQRPGWRHAPAPRAAVQVDADGPPARRVPLAAVDLEPRCSHCGMAAQALTRGRCHTCYVHWRRYGVDRPRHLLDPTYRPSCRNCGQPSSPQRRAYCEACYEYRHRHGVERPTGGAPVPRPRPLSGTCQRGHPRTAENTYIDPRGKRTCRVCRRQGIWYEPPRAVEQSA